MHIHDTLSRIKPCDTSVMHASPCVQVTLPPEANLSQTEATTPGSAPTDVTQRQWHLLSYLPPTTSQQRPNQRSPRLTAAYATCSLHRCAAVKEKTPAPIMPVCSDSSGQVFCLVSPQLLVGTLVQYCMAYFVGPVMADARGCTPTTTHHWNRSLDATASAYNSQACHIPRLLVQAPKWVSS